MSNVGHLVTFMFQFTKGRARLMPIVDHLQEVLDLRSEERHVWKKVLRSVFGFCFLGCNIFCKGCKWSGRKGLVVCQNGWFFCTKPIGLTTLFAQVLNFSINIVCQVCLEKLYNFNYNYIIWVNCDLGGSRHPKVTFDPYPFNAFFNVYFYKKWNVGIYLV